MDNGVWSIECRRGGDGELEMEEKRLEMEYAGIEYGVGYGVCRNRFGI